MGGLCRILFLLTKNDQVPGETLIHLVSVFECLVKDLKTKDKHTYTHAHSNPHKPAHTYANTQTNTDRERIAIYRYILTCSQAFSKPLIYVHTLFMSFRDILHTHYMNFKVLNEFHTYFELS